MNGGHGFFERNKGQNIVPSLGLLWSNCINERMALKKKGSYGGSHEPKRFL